MKTDDDTFLIVENLKKLLYQYDANKLLATGLALRDWTDVSFKFN